MEWRKPNKIKIAFIVTYINVSLFSCNFLPAQKSDFINPEGKLINTRFILPDGYQRIQYNEGTFEYYLQHLPLKDHGSVVSYYNGEKKNKKNVYLAVIDMEIGSKNLQQCADAIIRLRSEFLYSKKKYNNIHFNYTNGFRVDYTRWMKGDRIKVTGNKCEWIHTSNYDNSYSTFRKYLDNIFMYAGTLSLSAEMKKINYQDLKPGDVLIQGGSPGHAVIVVDMAIHSKSGKKIYMLAQSYMPAQEIQILCNPENSNTPWYELNNNEENIFTPEWTFTKNDAKRFHEE